jgi:secondary thiamine-phosphate synthase enzyme
MKLISIKSSEDTQLIDITQEVEKFVRESGTKEGAVNIFTMHTTTGILINENEPRLLRDYKAFLNRVLPKGASYAHDAIDDNAHAHLRSVILGSSKLVPIIDGKLGLGAWQRIFFVELDGPRTRKVVLQILKCS